MQQKPVLRKSKVQCRLLEIKQLGKSLERKTSAVVSATGIIRQSELIPRSVNYN